MNLFLVVLAGGSGTRFWPKSTSKRPKQLLVFGEGRENLLQETISRFAGVVPDEQRIVVTGQGLAASVQQAAPGVEILAEPTGRNSAPAIYWAAKSVESRDPEALLLVMAADHFIGDRRAFLTSLRIACDRTAAHDEIATLGIVPTRPETGYGYLETGDLREDGTRQVIRFVEKPDRERAALFLKTGRFLWNGGMFVARASVFLKAFDEHLPEARKTWESCGGDPAKAYARMPAISIDFGVMEKARNVFTVPLDCGWDDIGSWTALESLADGLKNRNAAGVGNVGKLISIASTGNILDIPPGKLVALLGAEDLIIADTGQALLVARKDRAQDIRLLVEQAKKIAPELT